MMMIGFFAIVSMRINMGIAMTCMVNSTAVTLTELALRNEQEKDYSIATDPFLTNNSIVEEIKEIYGKCSRTNESDKTVVNDYGVGYFNIY